MTTGAISWQDSGKGPVPLTLEEANRLALLGNFVFPGDSSRANLQNMFDHFGVNSLTAFKQKFFAYELDPTSSSSAKKNSSRSKTVWGTQQRGTELYIGQLVNGKRHGPGFLLSQGSSTAPFVYLGQFQEGLRNGYGAITSPRGETFQGFFKDDFLWGPGCFTFPRPDSLEAQKQRHRVRFDGMHNGRPCGKGVLVWSDGERQYGEFDGMALILSKNAEGCEGVVLMAQKNAELAKRVAAETEDELKRHGLWEGEAEQAMQAR